MDQHSKEPWRAGKVWESIVADGPPEGQRIVGDDDGHRIYGGFLVAESIAPANRRRILACVNLLAGIPTETLEVLAEGGRVARRIEVGGHVEKWRPDPLVYSTDGQTSVRAAREIWAGGDPARKALVHLHDLLIGDDSGDPRRIPSEVVQVVVELMQDVAADHKALADIYDYVRQPGERGWKGELRDAVLAEVRRLTNWTRAPLALLPAQAESAS